MPALLDLPAVRRFTEKLNGQLHQCDKGAGIICSDLEKNINFHVQLCRELRSFINDWARTVFTGQTPFDREIEDQLKFAAWQFLQRAKPVAARGRSLDGWCFVLQGLNELHYHVAYFGDLLENWVSPRPSVGPAPRVTLSEAVTQEVSERLAQLPAVASK